MELGERSPSPSGSNNRAMVPLLPHSSSAQDPAPSPLTDSTLQSPCSPAVREEHTGQEFPRDKSGEGRGGSWSGTTLRSARTSAFPSSLAWDSDSEKDMLDEEELQHFSNPHGLAAHSPGPTQRSPALGHRQERPEGEVDKAPEKQPHLIQENDPPSLVDGWDQGGVSTPRHEPETAQPSSPDSEENGEKEGAAKLCARPLLSEAKPKDGRRKGGGAKDKPKPKPKPKGKGKEEDGPGLDVYSFPGDSDPESPPPPPPAPWAHCTFTQRRRRKRALLRPFSGLGSQQHAIPETERRGPKGGLLEPEAGVGSGAFKCKEEERDQNVERTTEEVVGVEEKVVREEALCQEVFTCVECSIYFKKQVHLQEHMQQHCQGGGPGGWRGEGSCRGEEGKGGSFECVECRWELADAEALAEHCRQHQESRQRILEEISKLDKEGKGAGEQSGQGEEPEFGAGATLCSPRLRCPQCSFSTDSPRAYVEHARVHVKERKGQRGRGRGLSKRAQVHPVPPGPRRPSAQTSPLHLRVSGELALREHTRQSHPPQHTAWAGEMQEEHCPGTSRSPPSRSDQDSASSPAGMKAGAVTRGGAFTQLARPPPSPSLNSSTGARRRDVAFKSIGNRRGGRRASGGMGSALPMTQPGIQHSKAVDSENQDQNKGQVIKQKERESDPRIRKPFLPGSVEMPTPAMQLKRSFSDSLQGAAESLGLTEGQQTQLRHMVPLVLIESFHFCARIPSSDSDPALGESDKGIGKYLPVSSHVLNSSPGDQDDDDDDDDDDEEEEEEEEGEESALMSEESLGEEVGMLKNIERKCPYCPDRFHNGIGLANHVRGHLNRVGVSYNVRHFISPEEVNAIERKFSYQKKRKKVANFDPDTFSLMRCEFCSAGFDTRAGLSSHARAHLRDFGITNWEVTVSPINILRELFSSRPDLVLPTAPPAHHDSDLEEEFGVAEASGDAAADSALSSLPPSPPSPNLLSALEEGEEESKVPAREDEISDPAGTSSEPFVSETRSTDSPAPRDELDAKATTLLKCEVCEAPFETRRGLSSHARSHLRQLGIGMSESSGAPIDLLYQLIKERDDSFPPAAASHHGALAGRKDMGAKAGAGKASTPDGKPASSRSPSPCAVAKSRSASPLLRKAPISSLLPASSPLRSMESKPGSTSTSAKPFWAPQDTDAPLNLTVEVDASKDIVCQLCGAWFETRKGLSSHARAHLRHFGVVDAETKGSPIDYLNQLIHTDDFKRRASALQSDISDEPLDAVTGLSPPAKRAALSPHAPGLHKSPSGSKTAGSGLLLRSPPTKRLKPSAAERAALQVFRLSTGELTSVSHGEPLKEVGCEFCGEYFENRKGLSSHARSHLRQLGITEWSVNGSPIDTLRELIARRGLPCALPGRPLKSPPPSPISPRSPSASPSSPGVLKRLPFHLPGTHQPTARKAGTASATSGLIRPKPEPVQLELAVAGVAGATGGYNPDPLPSSWTGHDNLPLNLATAPDPEPTRDIRCEFCGEYFENRKGLSSHARSHLRQLGITEWTVNGSPIDTLRELMRKKGTPPAGQVKKEPGFGGSSGWEELGHLPPKFSRKSPLSMVPQGPRMLKSGLGVSLSLSPLNGKGSGYLGVSSLGKRPPSEEGRSSERPSPKAFSHPPLDFSFKGKSSPDKYGASHSATDASCELCGFYFENRKALASHARAHLRQFGVTEWCVNGSPIETLSAWMRSRPQKVAEIHRRYMQGDRPFPKKKCGLSSSLSTDLGVLSPGAHKPLSSQRPSLGLPHGRRAGREVTGSAWGSSRAAQGGAVTGASMRQGHQGLSRQTHALPHSQVARSELNVRSPRGFERRPPKHLSHSEGGEREAGPPQPPRTGTIPALVPKPPSTSLVKLVGKIYSLKCRFCEVEFHGPLSVQEDWIRHLQKHILDLNFSKPDAPSSPVAAETPSTAPLPAPPPAADPPPNPVSTQGVSPAPITVPTSTSTPTPSPSPAPVPPPTPIPTSPPISTGDV